MIVREKDPGFLLINQHDHGLVSAGFAKHFSDEWLGETPLRGDALFAIENHDIGWKTLDAEVSWNEERGRPCSFIDYPAEPKMEAYAGGLDLVESESAYAALLCSSHYGSFVEKSEVPAEVRFREGEKGRRERISASMPEGVPETFERDFRLLQLCDDLSLFVCLNEPGGEIFSWHKNGFEFSGRRFHPVWNEDGSLRFDPSPFSGSFDVSLPYRVVDGGGFVVERNDLELRVTL